MKTLVILVMLGALLTSCRDNLEHVAEQCSPFIVYSDERTIDVEASVCLCRQYKFSKDFVGPLPGSGFDKPLSYCNKIVGFPKYVEVATYWELVRRTIANQRKGQKGFAREVTESTFSSASER
jgi:hypothetical protein